MKIDKEILEGFDVERLVPDYIERVDRKKTKKDCYFISAILFCFSLVNNPTSFVLRM